VAAAAAGVDHAEREVVYAVTRAYFTVVYAREQERVARGVVERLAAIHDTAHQQLQAGAREITAADVNRTSVYLHLAKTKQIQAAQGVERALAALKEALGLGPEACLVVPPGELPAPELRLCRGDIVAWALTRRPDLAQAGLFAEAACLEVEAQGTNHRTKMETFAAGSDIHARRVAPGGHNSEYRPGAIVPEMPTLLVGSQPERMKHAQSLHARAEAVVEEARNLIALEAEDAFLRWQEASQAVAEARSAVVAGDQLADSLTKDFTSGLKVRVEDVVNARVLASQARAQLNNFLYHQVVALADLERVTAGAFCAGLVGSTAAQPQPAPKPKESTGADELFPGEKRQSEGKPGTRYYPGKEENYPEARRVSEGPR
jgi:outer membrane protein TolC